MRKLTLGDAAKRAGVSKATISKALSSNKLSGEKIPTANGRYEFSIDPSELDRVFPHKQPDEQAGEQNSTHAKTHDKHQENSVLQVEVNLLREALADARQERDRWRDMADRLAIAPPTPAPMPSLWQRLFGKA